MLNKTIGFIGGGNMASAMIGGILSSGLTDASHLIASAKTENTRNRLRDSFGIDVTPSNPKVAEASDILFLAVKPYLYEEIIHEIRDSVAEDTVIVAIAAGQSIRRIESAFGRDIRLVRSMPNTPALVLEAMSALTPNENISDEELSEVCSIFASFGRYEIVPESLMDAVTGVSGSSPAYVYLFIESMADAAVRDGLPRAQAYKFAAQSVLGAAKMVLETGRHPGELKDAVCSPGGTTIEAVTRLEAGGFRSAVIEAQNACTAKSKAMSGKDD